MLSDRSYARDNYHERPTTSVLAWFLCALVASFLLQLIFENLIPGGENLPYRAAALSPEVIREGHIWTLFTYALLHDTGNYLHLLFNALTIYFMGREILPLLGSKRFSALLAFSAISGGLFWLAVNFGRPGAMVIGASAIAIAFVILYACIYPNNKIVLLIFFVIPVPIRPKYVAIGLAVMDVVGLFLYEIPGREGWFNAAHSAHIGGMIAAVLYYFFVYRREWRNADGHSAGFPLPEWLKKKDKPASVASPKYKVNITSQSELRAEVDRILDKINSHGFASLTDEEKRTLDNAKDMISGR